MKIKDKFAGAKAYVLQHKKASIGIAAGLIALLLTVITLCLFSCSSSKDAPGNITDQDPIGDITFALGFNKGDSQGESKPDNPEEDSAGNTDSNEQTSSANAAQEEQPARQSPEAESTAPESSSDSATTGNNNGSSQPSLPTAQEPAKKWVVDYKQIWVEDSAAWTESVPVYEREEISVCSICGATITGDESAHGKAHMLAGEGSGHHTETTKVITGYDYIFHEQTGHYETVESGGHWE